jgi:2-polyprenyl-6-methoxyphenol hydroxylase-like FAD-dependent oxidoreductase
MKRIIIVGAGPAGALLAHLLARRGAEVTLVERQVDFGREFRGEVLMQSGIDALRQAGFAAKLDALPYLVPRAVEIFRGARKMVSIPTDDPAIAPRITPQPQLLEMIVGEAARHATFRLERATTARELIWEDGRAAGIRADTREGARELRADFVIGTDGRASAVRKQAGFTADRVQQAFDIVWAKVPGPFLDHRTARFYVGRGHLFIVYPSPEGHVQLGWVIKKGTFGDFRKLGAEGWMSQIAPHVSPDLADLLESHRNSLEHPVLLDVICDCVREWSAPGVMVLGDAAHPMSPVGGQGINVALRDAIVAANHFGAALARDAGGAELDDAARRIEAERMPEVAAIQELQQMGPRLLFADSLLSPIATSAPVLWFARTFLAPIFVRRAQPFLRGVSEVRLEQS